jgi:hypothetical protein
MGLIQNAIVLGVKNRGANKTNFEQKQNDIKQDEDPKPK